jgi:hypothetical protein
MIYSFAHGLLMAQVMALTICFHLLFFKLHEQMSEFPRVRIYKKHNCVFLPCVHIAYHSFTHE